MISVYNLRLPMTPSPKTILICDDDQGMRETIAAILGRDYRVLTVSSGEAALTLLRQEEVDVMLQDVRLPGISGFDVLRHLVLRRSDLLKRTIVMTAATDESLQFIDRNAVGGVLRKPFEVGSLPDLVAKV